MSIVGDMQDRDDRPPYVRFERRDVEDKKRTLQEGRYVGRDVDFALITPPYSKDCVEIQVEKWFENQERYVRNGRTPAAWLDHWKKGYEAWKKNEEIPEFGTPIKNWPAISPAQAKMILGAGIRTVEDLAACNDEGLKRLGMGGRDLMDKAKSWVKATQDQGKVAIENAALQKENTRLKQTVENLEGKVMELQSILNQKNSRPVVIREIEVEEGETISAADILDEPLEDQYIAKFGKKPHHLMKEETIRRKLQEE